MPRAEARGSLLKCCLFVNLSSYNTILVMSSKDTGTGLGYCSKHDHVIRIIGWTFRLSTSMIGAVMRQIIGVLTIILVTTLSGCSGNGGQQLFETAQLEELQDNREHARQLYQEILDRYPETEYARKANERLSALGQSE
jgi:hypothetical protein